MKKLPRLFALLAVPLLVATGCAEESSSDPGAAADLTSAQERIDQYSSAPAFEAPGDAFDAGAAMAGATIASIPVNSAIDFTQFYAEAAQRIADAVGFEITSYQNQGVPTEWGQGVTTAIAADVDLIELFAGIDPAQIAPQMIQAEEAGIPVLATDGYDLTQNPDGSVTGSVPCPCSLAGQLMADWVTVQTEGAGTALVLTSSDVYASSAMEEVMREEFSDVCPGCDVRYIDVPSADWATKILPQVQAELVADPEIDYVLPVFDTMSIWATQAITQSGRDDVRIATYNGTPSILQLMGESDVIEMNVGQSNDWMAHVVLDQAMRQVAGLPLNPKASWPLYIWTKENLAEAGTPPTDSQGYGSEYRSAFLELWGLA
jgi:ribose transport system substrate-binding protein